MSKYYEIDITDGSGSLEVSNGKYNVFSLTTGYENLSLYPYEIEVKDDIDTYDFWISGSGILSIKVTEDGTMDGIPVAGAVFYRCDEFGNRYGEARTSSYTGRISFYHLPFDKEDAPTIYFVQTSSKDHVFDPSIKEIKLTNNEQEICIKNGIAPTKNFIINDLYYKEINNLDGIIKFKSNSGDEFYAEIVNSKGSCDIPNGIYQITPGFIGYTYNSYPSEIEITSDIDNYDISIEASGKLKVNITDDGTLEGEPIIGASLHRCDYRGNILGDILTTNRNGLAIIENLPHDIDNAPPVYLRQISSDGKHRFYDDVLETKLIAPDIDYFIKNPPLE